MKHIASLLVAAALSFPLLAGGACPQAGKGQIRAAGPENYITTKQTGGLLTLSEPGYVSPILVS